MNMFGRIQLLMLQRGMNKTEFSKAIGVSSGNMSDWANGRSSPGVEKLIKIADFFDVSIDYLIGREDRYPIPSPDACELMRIYDALDREGRVMVMSSAYSEKRRMDSSAEQGSQQDAQ